MDKYIYADNAATTPVLPEVVEEMMPYFTEGWGNPSSLYKIGEDAKASLTSSRKRVADILGCHPDEIYFTSCGSESDSWAIKGYALANMKKGRHIITTKFEHHAVLNSMKQLEKLGFEVTYLTPDSEGIITAEDVEGAIREDTILVCTMFANNEIGVILPIKQIAEVCKKHKVTCFTDAVQAVGNIPVSIPELGVDMLSASGHKIHAPKGVGILYIRRGIRIDSLISGGGQERGKRGGTENTAYAAAFARALEIAVGRLDDMKRVQVLRDELIDGILERIPYSRLNGSRTSRLPGNVNISFEFIEGESMLFLLSSTGVCASTGSACSSTSLEPSHVLLSIGLPHEIAHGSLRLSLSHENTHEDVEYILKVLPPIIQRLRDMSPLYDAVRKEKANV